MEPIKAAIYNKKIRENINQVLVQDLDSAHQLFSNNDSSYSFKNLLVGKMEEKRDRWQTWISNEVFELSDKAGIYLLNHTQETTLGQINRFALYCSLSVYDEALLTHENTQADGVERARQGAEACEADLAPIFVGLGSEKSSVFRSHIRDLHERNNSIVSCTLEDGSRFSMSALYDKEQINEVKKFFQQTELFLLDGHHRLAAAKINTKNGMSDGRILTCISSMQTEDLKIYPIHRTLSYPAWGIPERLYDGLLQIGAKKVKNLAKNIESIESFIRSDEANGRMVVLHAYDQTPTVFDLPKVKNSSDHLDSISAYRLEKMLEPISEIRLNPTSEPSLALEELATDHADAAFFLPAASTEAVCAVARAREIMPRKSTRFVPKPALGLVVRPWGI
ncbi:MAG: DUF1015 domain-containing protein [Oligoflexia bacterium]|nr:DUF1015 domain-containing protein [Oligoflexia bacterium]